MPHIPMSAIRALSRARLPRTIRSLLAIVLEALRWAEHVTTSGSSASNASTPSSKSLRPFEKAVGALTFTLQFGFSTLAVPTKLVGVKAQQPTVRDVRRSGARFGHKLRVTELGGRVAVSWDDGRMLGFVQRKHEAWLRPLLQAGAGIYLIRVTGDEARGHTLGVNVAIGSFREALDTTAPTLAPFTGDTSVVDTLPRDEVSKAA